MRALPPLLLLLLLAPRLRADDLDAAARLLRSSKPEDLVKGAHLCRKLGRGAARLAPALAGKLGHANEDVQMAADRALQAIGCVAFDALVPILTRSDAHVRLLAASLLAGYSASMERVEAHAVRLVAALRDNDLQVRAKISPVFLKFSPDAAPALLAAFPSDDASVRETAARAVARHFRPGELAEQAKAEDWARRDAAARALGWIGDPEGAVPLTRLLADPHEQVRISAARSIGRLRPDPALVLGPLRAALEDPEPPVRFACADALAALGEAARDLSREDLAAGNPVRRGGAARVLARLGGSEEAIRAALADPTAEVRAEVARALVASPFPGHEVVAALHGLLRDESARVRAGAAHALSLLECHMADVLPILLQLPADDVTTEALAVHGWRSGPAVRRLIDSLKDGSPRLRRAAVNTLVAIRSDPAPDLAGAWRTLLALPDDVRAAAHLARKWLVAQQTETGGWNSAAHGGLPAYDVGVTALALLALRAAGPEAPEAVSRARAFLGSRQDESGWLAPPVHNRICQHSIATWALAEALLLAPDRTLREVVRKAVGVLEASRNPHLGWRYEPRGGENDTHETVWALCALRFAALASVSVDPQAAAGGLSWLDKMTDPEFGQVGYNMPGSGVARLRVPGAPTTEVYKGREQPSFFGFPSFETAPSQALTAAAVWCCALLREPDAEGIRAKGRGLLIAKMPDWDLPAGKIDLYYWHWGALALAVPASDDERTWCADLRTALLSSQTANGSWEPVDVWGSVGGRVYSTAMATLALLGASRYPASVHSGSAPPAAPVAEIDGALEKVKRDLDPAVRYAAQRALAGLAPFED